MRDGCHPVRGATRSKRKESKRTDERCKVSLSSTSAASLSRALIRGEGFSRSRGDALPVLECVCDLARTLNALLSRACPLLSLIHARSRPKGNFNFFLKNSFGNLMKIFFTPCISFSIFRILKLHLYFASTYL